MTDIGRPDPHLLDGSPSPKNSDGETALRSAKDILRDLKALLAAKGSSKDKERKSTIKTKNKSRWWPSVISQRIILINLCVLALLMGSILYFTRAQDNLVNAHQRALQSQARTIANVLAETGVVQVNGRSQLDRELVIPILRRVVGTEGAHARLYDFRRRLLADSNLINDVIVQRSLAPPGDEKGFWAPITNFYDLFTEHFASSAYYPESFVTDEASTIQASIDSGLLGDDYYTVRRDDMGQLIVSYAVPVQPLKNVLGVLLLEVSDIDDVIRQERVALMRIFAIAIVVSLIASFLLAQTIAKPVQTLAHAADQVRLGASERGAIPDFTERRDEIGELSHSLSEMTSALYDRIDAIEAFAADVAHEIKNPLTSLRSAVETFDIAKTDDMRARLLNVIKDDVGRIDRLISDISNASRLDAELARESLSPIDLGHLLPTIGEMYRTTQKPDEPSLDFKIEPNLMIAGLEGSLGQVFRNLIDNAKSFSPPGGVVTITARRRGHRGKGRVIVSVSDQGPGIPEENLKDIFDRFYTSRPSEASFGKHSGLGLAISEQIVEAHRGEIRAENIVSASGDVQGARFIVSFPALS